jgi:exopolysaccharide biosynthesis polyprenyl glycosylphosphotransferase
MPISRHESFRIQVLQLMDALLVWGCFASGNLVRDWLRATDDDYNTNWVLYIAVPFTPLLLEFFGFYRRVTQRSTGTSIAQILKALFLIAFVIGLMTIFAKMPEARRLGLGLGLLFVFFAMLVRDRALAFWRKRKRAHHTHGGEHVVIAGKPDEMESLLNDLDDEALSAWHIVDRFDLHLRPAEDLYELLKRESVGRVIIAPKGVDFDKVGQAVQACELQGVEAWIAAAFIQTQIARPVFDVVGDKPMLVLRSTPELSWELMIKEIFDRVSAAFIILASSPLWLIAWIGIRRSSPGAPVLFSQERAGRYGSPFAIWKFRTMVPNAEELLEKIKKEHGNQMQGPVFKLDNDPRIFPFGQFLRKWSIDELPQLINVVRGEMSLVGPRPLPLYEVHAFTDLAHRRRLSVKPGITCEWQVSGRNEITSFEQWVELDLRYIDNWSLWLDFRILLRTIPAVLFGKGAK